MRLDRFITPRRIVELQSVNVADAVKELLSTVLPAGTSKAAFDETLETLMQRKTALPGRVDTRVRLARSRSKYVAGTTIAIGRFKYEKLRKDPSVPPPECVLTLLLVPEKAKNYTEILAELLKFLGNDDFLGKVDFSLAFPKFRRALTKYFHGEAKSKVHVEQNKLARAMGKVAHRVAVESGCTHFFMFADTFSTPPLVLNMVKDYKFVVVSEKNLGIHDENGNVYDEIIVKAFSAHRLPQLRSAIFTGLMRGILKPTDRVACFGGKSKSDCFDTFMIVNVIDEFPAIVDAETAKKLVPEHIKPAVVEKAISLATDLAVEGREGKAVGTMFIIGRLEDVKPHIEPLIMNPFAGHSEEDRDFLDPFAEETIKELSLIDGSFVIDENGVIDSAGVYVSLSKTVADVSLPGGLGTRHMAACAISLAVACVVVVVSSSGQVTLFRNGEATIMHERSHGRAL